MVEKWYVGFASLIFIYTFLTYRLFLIAQTDAFLIDNTNPLIVMLLIVGSFLYKNSKSHRFMFLRVYYNR